MVTLPASAAPAADVLASTLTCNSAVNLFAVSQTGVLSGYPHTEPENGNNNWGTQTNMGTGWASGRVLAGPNGVFYLAVSSTGDLLRYHWNGTAWDTFNGAYNRNVGNGWGRYGDPAHRNKITVDEKGRLYEIDATGRLDVFIWEGDDATGNWSADSAGGKPLDTGWDKYDLIVAAGDGVLYARQPDGQLFRYRYHAASHRFVQYEQYVGGGWGMFNHITSPGGDILYGAWNSPAKGPELLWYRYLEDTNKWADTGGAAGKQVGTGWYGERDVTADPNGCRLTGFPAPTRPTGPQRFYAPNTPLLGPDNKVSVFYTNSHGGLSVAKQDAVGDLLVFNYETFPEYQKFHGQPGAAVREDGKIEVLANSYDDGAYRGKTQQVKDGFWGTNNLTDQGGWMQSDPIVVKEADKTLTTYAVGKAVGTDSNVLYYRKQAGINGAQMAWRSFKTAGITTDFTAVASTTPGHLVVARFSDNTVRVLRTNNGVGSWKIIDTNAIGRPAAVVHQNGDLQVFLTRADGRVYTKRFGSTADTWQVVGNTDFILAAGPTTAVLASGLIHLGIRGSDNSVYLTTQAAPASSTYSRWDITRFAGAATDPTAVVLPDGKPLFTWRTSDNVLYVAQKPNTGSAGFQGAEVRRR